MFTDVDGLNPLQRRMESRPHWSGSTVDGSSVSILFRGEWSRDAWNDGISSPEVSLNPLQRRMESRLVIALTNKDPGESLNPLQRRMESRLNGHATTPPDERLNPLQRRMESRQQEPG